MQKIVLFLIAASTILSCLPVAACPDCSEGIRKQVIAGIFDDRFSQNLLFTIAPFLIFGALTMAIHFSGPQRVNRNENSDILSRNGGSSADEIV